MSQDRKAREKLVLLADALMQDILETSDIDIVAEVDREEIDHARTILIEVKMSVSAQLLTKARAQHEAWNVRRLRTTTPLDHSTARDRFEKIKRGDPEFNHKIILAARNGKAPSEADVDGIAEDWADLQRLDGEGTEE